MKNILLVLLSVFSSCSYKSECKAPIWVVFVFSEDEQFNPKVDSSNTDSVILIERCTSGNNFTSVTSYDTIKVSPYYSDQHFNLKEPSTYDTYDNDYRITIFPSGKQYIITDFIVHKRHIKCTASDCLECFNNVGYTINGQIRSTKNDRPGGSLTIFSGK